MARMAISAFVADNGAAIRGQFKGYMTEKGVPPDSAVETFAALRLEIQS